MLFCRSRRRLKRNRSSSRPEINVREAHCSLRASMCLVDIINRRPQRLQRPVFAPGTHCVGARQQPGQVCLAHAERQLANVLAVAHQDISGSSPRISSIPMASSKSWRPAASRRGTAPPHVALLAAMRSLRSAISLWFIDPPHTHENSANSSLERSKNRCALPTLSPGRPASCRRLSFAASANAERGCAR